ncbi:MAG: LPS export ABC transporter ATP-binding protein [Candidatus Hydrogenedentota bacterium]
MAADNTALLQTRDLVKDFKGRVVVQDVSIGLKPGEIAGLLGPNGAGKTTTFNMAVGLLRPTSGQVWFNGADVTRLPMYKRARAGMAYLPQEASVFRKLTVRQNLMAVLEFLPLTLQERRARTDRLLDELGVSHVADNPAYTLSGGERRRTEICRALVTEPKVFLLDEPFAGIDPIAVADLQDTVATLKRKAIGVLITDHNVRETLEITDRAYIISEGRIAAAGTPREIAENPLARKTYLGEKFRMDFGEEIASAVEADEPPAYDPAFLRDGDILDWDGLIAALREGTKSNENTPANRIIERMDPAVSEALLGGQGMAEPRALRRNALQELNILLRRPDLYNAKGWAYVKLDKETKKLASREPSKLPPRQLTQFNRRLLELAFPSLIRPHEPS